MICVMAQRTGAKLGAGVTCLLEDQYAGSKKRINPLEMQRSGETRRSATEDEDVRIHS